MSDPSNPNVPAGTILGRQAKPSFAVLPDCGTLFLSRARRFAALAPGHQLEPYLGFLAVVCGAQHAVQASVPAGVAPSPESIAQALQHGMPPLPRMLHDLDEPAARTFEAFFARLSTAELPPQATAIVRALSNATGEERRRLVSAALQDDGSHDAARRSLVSAALQVCFAQRAACLTADALKPIATGACPACGSAPVASAVVDWPNAHNTRYCACSLCSTMWNVVRVTCLVCGSTDGVSYRGVEGKADTVKAETCDKCHGYVKILYQVKDPSLDPVADDVATLGLDMLLAEDGWKRGAHNPFLLGY